MATSESSYLYFPSFILGFLIVLFIYILILVLNKIMKSRINRQSLSDTTPNAKRNLARNSRKSHPNFAPMSNITTITTMPRHAISDMDRDIESQKLKYLEIQNLEVGVYPN